MKLLDRALRRPRALLGALIVLSALCVPLLWRIDLQGDLVDLLPRSSTAAATFGTFNRQFVAGQELIILVTCADPEKLITFAESYVVALRGHRDVQQVTYRISPDSLRYLRDHLLLLLNDADLDELARRLTPEALQRRATELRTLLSAPGGSALAPLLTADPLELAPLITQRLASGLQVDARSGYLRTADGTALLIKVQPSFPPMLWDRGEQLVRELGELGQKLGGEVAETTFANSPTPRLSFTGSYAFPPYFRRWMETDMTRSTMLSIGAVLLLFGVFFRSLRILPVVLLPLLLAGLWTAAAAALLYGRISAVSMAFATILVAIGIDVPIQLYNRLREELARPGASGRSAHDIARETVCLLASPAIVATLGPAAVFFCCGFSDFRGLNQLGILAGVGLCLNCVAMLTVFPALLLILPTRLWLGKLPVGARPGDGGGLLAGVGRLSQRRPRTVLLVAAALFVVALPLMLRAGLGKELLSMDLGGMPPALTQQEVSRRFGEHQRFLIALIEDPDAERARHRADLWLDAAEALRKRGALNGYEALGTLLPSETTQAQRRARLQKLNLGAAADRLQAALDAAGFELAPFGPFLALLRASGVSSLQRAELEATELGFLVRSHLADLPAGVAGVADPPAPARHLVALFLFAPAGDTLAPTLAALDEIARGPAGGALTGLPLLEDQLRTLLGQDLRRITGFSVAAVALLLLVYYRRARPFLAVLLPLSLAWVLFGATLYLLKIPLHLYNILCVPLVIGYGIDDHIFLVHRYQALPPAERDPVPVLNTTGRAIVLTTLSTMAGFLGLLPAHFVGLRELGLGGALAVLLCMLAALLVLPALLVLWWPPPAPGGDEPAVSSAPAR